MLKMVFLYFFHKTSKINLHDIYLKCVLLSFCLQKNLLIVTKSYSKLHAWNGPDIYRLTNLRRAFVWNISQRLNTGSWLIFEPLSIALNWFINKSHVLDEICSHCWRQHGNNHLRYVLRMNRPRKKKRLAWTI